MIGPILLNQEGAYALTQASRRSSMVSLSSKKLAVIGLGYVGLPLAVAFGSLRPVVGFDKNTLRIQELKDSFDRTMECSREQLIAARYLQFTNDQHELADCSVFILSVPTPLGPGNKPDLSYLNVATALVGQYLKSGDVVIYESTVFPGATEEIFAPILEKVSGLVFNKDFYCGFSPERTNPGDKINTLTTVTKIVSGSNAKITEEIGILYSQIVKPGTWNATSIKVAEAAKIIENTQRDLNIALINEIAVIFERLGIDTAEVLEAASTKWNFLHFRPGMVGGHCIGVDPYYLTFKAEQVGYHPQLILAGRKINENMARYAARNILKRMSNNGIDLGSASLGVLGVTFKENCPDIRNSKVFDLIKEFKAWGVNVVALDPWADPSDVSREYGVQLVDSMQKRSLDSVVVAVAHSDFKFLSPSDLRKLCKNNVKPVLGDLKAIYDRHECAESGFEVYRL